MKSIRWCRGALVLAAALVACATQDQQTGVMSQQATSACLRGGVPCTASDVCCSRRCEGAVCQAHPLETPESIESRSPDDLPSEPTSGLGTPDGQESGPQ